MKKLICNLYSFDELSKEAQHIVCEEARSECLMSNSLYDEATDRKRTLDKFCDIFGIEYEIDYDHCYRFITWSFKDEELENKADKICGKYLWRFLDKHYYDIRSEKYFSTRGYFDENKKYHYKFRHSKIMWEEQDCPFTGVCVDEDILECIYDWYKNPDWNLSLHELFKKCFSLYMRYWREQDDYLMSDEYLGELISDNYDDRLYFEDGTKFTGNYDECTYYIEEEKSA